MIPAPPTLPPRLPLREGKEDGENQFLLAQASQASLSSCPVCFDPTEGQHKGYCNQDETEKQYPKCQEDLDMRQLSNDPLPISNVNGNHCSLSHRTPNGKSDEDHEFGCNNMRFNCTTSKMKLMRKAMKWNRKIEKSEACDDDSKTTTSVTTATTRVCSDCNTTKTPLWRTGPHGPKSLCNACGIRRRKERRAMAAAGDDLVPSAASPSIGRWSKQKWQESHHTTQYKKRCKNTAPRSRKKIRFEEFNLGLRKNSALHQVFPQDEKDAAILLMALSCGLVCS